MNDKELEGLLYSIGEDEILPSEELMLILKSKMEGGKPWRYVMTASILLNLMMLFIPVYFILFSGISWLSKALIYTITSTVMNSTLLLVYIFKKQIMDFFRSREFTNL